MNNNYKNYKLKIKKILIVFRNYNYRLIKYRLKSSKKCLLSKKNLIN